MGRRILVLLTLSALAAALLFGTQFARSDRADEPTTVAQEPPASEPLTSVERQWCVANPGRVAWAAYWEYGDEGAPALHVSERTTGELRPSTVEALREWRAANPDLYDSSCREGFARWAGKE